MENQGWKGSSSHSGSPSHSPSHTSYQVQSTYFPSEDHYVQQQQADDDPFNLKGSDNPFANTLSGQSEVVAVPDHSTVTINTGERQANVVLQFQDSQLPTHGTTGKMGGDQVPWVGSYSENRSLTHGSTHSAGAGNGDDEPDKKYWFLNIKRYRRFFNVDTEDILIRMRDSVIGSYKADFFDKTTDNADLYGPFWVATTLVFVIAATGNYANYVSYKKKHSGTSSTTQVWYSNVNKVGYSAILFYGYVGLIGLMLYACLRWWFKSKISLPQVWCIYGYALSIFVPISFICILPYEWLRWLLVAIATSTSGLFLLTNFKAPIFDVAGAKALPIFVAVGAVHIALGLVLKLYFFQYWS